ncbi:MAG: sulfite exporter TauE/SafE family protein [Cyclobacteriaceae bacterium]
MLYSAFILGLLGSFHCLGMCGPLAFSLPKAGYHELSILGGSLREKFGRILSYATIGGVLGLIGKGIFLTGFQHGLSITLGVVLLVGLVFPTIFKWNFFYSFPNKVKARIIPLFRKRGLSFSFLIGIMNGFLPCGLVYIAVAGALATGEPILGMQFMILFGLGTLPMMLFAAYSSYILPVKFKLQMQKAIPAFVVVMALALILRGMNLGIPYLSPEIAASDGGEMVECVE